MLIHGLQIIEFINKFCKAQLISNILRNYLETNEMFSQEI